MPMSMLAPTVGLVVVSLLMTVFAGPLLGITDRAAADLVVRHEYVDTIPADAEPGRVVDSVSGVR